MAIKVNGTTVIDDSRNVTDVTLKKYVDTYYNGGTISGNTNIDLNNGLYQTFSINASLQLTPTNIPTGGCTLFLRLNMLGSYTITWNFGTLQWPNLTAPALISGKQHIFVFTTANSGTNWWGNCTIY